MPVRSTFSGSAVMGEMRDALNSIAASSKSQADSVDGNKHNLESINRELEKIRTGHELHNWGQEVDEPREEGD